MSQSTNKKQRLQVSGVQRVTNQMSRPRLEQLVVDMYRSSSEIGKVLIVAVIIAILDFTSCKDRKIMTTSGTQ
jgi:hypothetical protein